MHGESSSRSVGVRDFRTFPVRLYGYQRWKHTLLTPSVIAHWIEMDQTCHPVKDECVKVTVSEAAKENTVFLGKWASVTG